MSQPAELPAWIEIFHALSEIPLTFRDRTNALRRITELGLAALHSRVCTLTLVDLEQRTLVQAACAGLDELCTRQETGRILALGSTANGDHLDFERVASGELIEIYNLAENGQGIANPSVAQRYDLAAALCCPFYAEGKLIGYFNHFTQSRSRFTEQDRQLIELFARQVTITIEILDNLQKLSHADRLHRLNQTMQDMMNVRNVDDLMALLLDRGLELVGAVRGWVSRLNQSSGELQIVAQRGDPPSPHSLSIGQGITGKALQEGIPMCASDVRDPPWSRIYEEFWPDTRAELAVPIQISNAEVRIGCEVKLRRKPIGVFNLESTHPDVFSPDDRDLLSTLARHAAALADRLELDRKLANLTQIQQEIVGRSDWNAIIEDMLQAITKTLGYEYVNISLVDERTRRIKTEYSIGIPNQQINSFMHLADHSLDGSDIQADIVRTRQIEVPAADDIRFDPVIYHEFGHDRLIRVYLPLIGQSENRVIGTVEAGYLRSNREHIYEQDVQILKSFVDYVSRALEQRWRGWLDRVTHEMRSPIVGIRNNASFLQRRLHQLSEDLIEHKFGDMLADCEILLFQVKQLEYMLGRASPDAKIERTYVFRDVIIKTVRQLKPLVSERHFDPARIEYDPADIYRVNPLYVDKGQLNQVVYNLLANSIKYAEDDPAKFTIRIKVDTTRDAFVLIFKDWGIGIQHEYAQRIFEEGFRTPEAVRKNVSGSGLGLSIARRIMRELGGDLRLVNTYKPTEFHMVLPRTLAEASDDSDGR